MDVQLNDDAILTSILDKELRISISGDSIVIVTKVRDGPRTFN